MNPAEFIEFAGRVAAINPAGARSAVSRAYYGAFHLALELLEELGCALTSRRSHGVVSSLLQHCGNDDARHAGYLLSDLHSDRVKADYRLDNRDVESRPFAMLSVERASEIRSLLSAARAACNDPTVRDRIRAAAQAQLNILTGR